MARVHYEYIPDEPNDRDNYGPCAWCRHSRFTDTTKVECTRYGGSEDPRKQYSCFEKHPSRTLSSIERAFTWYIMTAICDILNINENNKFFTQIGTLIDLVREDTETKGEATMYDLVGPEIAVRLYRENNRVEFCTNLMTNYLAKAFVAIDENRMNDAINIYKSMVNFLYVRYTRKDNLENIIDVDVIAKPKILVK